MDGILTAIGNTPLVELEAPRGGAKLFAKIEGANPTGSVKDRPALGMVMGAERRGILKPGNTIIEATSGNMGAALAMVAAAKGYNCVIVSPEYTSEGKKRLIRRLGAQLIETPECIRIPGCMDMAVQMARENKWFLADQFSNPDNPASHVRTAAEIIAQLGQVPDALVLGWGTGGTLTGIATAMKAVKPDCRVFTVEINEYPHMIEGIYYDFTPVNLKRELIDEVIVISSAEGIDAAAYLNRKGYPVGLSSGAAWIAAKRASEALGEGRAVVTIFPDRCERYSVQD
ncbi:MAG: PLP-dependent cysteine synthase family protein [candidate division WOR-3 bacterium]